MYQLCKITFAALFALALCPTIQAATISTQSIQRLHDNRTVQNDIRPYIPSKFNGSFVGITLDNTKVSVDSETYYPGYPHSSFSASDDEHDFGLTVFLGFGQALQDTLYLGGEALLQYFMRQNDIDYENFMSLTNKTTINISSDSVLYGAAAKIGYIFSRNFMIYGLLGVAHTNFKVKSNNAVSGTNTNKSKSFTNFMPGIGLQMFVTDKLLLDAEYRHISYEKSEMTIAPGTSTIKIDPEMNVLSLGIIYLFG